MADPTGLTVAAPQTRVQQPEQVPDQRFNAKLDAMNTQPNVPVQQLPTPAAQLSPGARTGQDAGKLVVKREKMKFQPKNDEATSDRKDREFDVIDEVTLKFGNRANQTFDTAEEATTFARNLNGNGAAVVAEDGHYAVYQLQGTGLFSRDFNIGNVASDGVLMDADVVGVDPSVKAMVTKDQYVVDLAGDKFKVELSGVAGDPFAAHKKTFGEGLEKLHGNRPQFEKQFELAMRDGAFKALDNSEQVATAALGQLSGNQFTPADKAAIERSAAQMAPVDARIIAKREELSAAKREAYAADAALALNAGSYLPGMPSLRIENTNQAIKRATDAHAKLDRVQAELGQLQGERIQAARDFPLLLRIDPEKMAEFRGKSEASQVQAMRDEAKGVLRDINTTRANMKDGSFNLWTMPELRNATAAGLGIKGEQLKWVEGRAKYETRVEMAWKIGEGVVGVGLAVGGAFFTGGTSLALLGASTVLNLHGAVGVTSEYFRNSAAVNTDIDPSAGLLPPDMKSHWGWVAAAWIGVGMDVGAVTATVKALRSGAITLDQAAKALNTEPKVLRAVLKSAEANSFEVKTLGATEFAARYGNDAQAVTILHAGKDGRVSVEVISNAALSGEARAAALTEEFVHLQQLADPAMRTKMLRLSEENLGGWAQMGGKERASLVHTKLEVEADAQRIVIEHGGAGADKALAREHLANIEDRLAEIDAAQRAGRTPGWIENAEAPRLFSKTLPDQASIVRSAAGAARAEAMHPYQFATAKKALVEKKITDAASVAADKAYEDAAAQGLPQKQINNAVNKAAKDAAKKTAQDEAMRSAREAVEHAITNKTAFDPAKLDAATQTQLTNYAANQTGGNARRLAGQLNGNKDAEFLNTMADEVAAGRCTTNTANISGPPPQTMIRYEYPDGTVVRYKPLGDVKRPGPTYSIEVKKNPNLPDTGSDSAAFKVDTNGRPLPRGPHEVQNPYAQGTPQAKEFLDTLMNASHILLIP